MNILSVEMINFYRYLPFASCWHLLSPLMQLEQVSSSRGQSWRRMQYEAELASLKLLKVNQLQPFVDLHSWRHSSFVDIGSVSSRFPSHWPWIQHWGAGGSQLAGPPRQSGHKSTSTLVQLCSSWHTSSVGKKVNHPHLMVISILIQIFVLLDTKGQNILDTYAGK